ncbi:MAG TPA: flagellar hook capping FlgD N-terminal domain-containing protein [Lachnospiraceae bacterium]|nr:flagellar hook capping FlgD N-terminal domain-containing protein [Lachnospiraceae bacterium]
MSIVQAVKDGVLQGTTASQNSLSTSEKSSGSTLDKDAFLQLLVAQMKYQDPLEPTSNTEYISQFATFSSLEQMQNMSSSVDMERATTLVGKEVFMSVTNSSGNTETVFGKVDYVTMENGKIYLSIDDSLYSLDDLDTVVDPDYWKAYNLAIDWTSSLSKLSTVERTTLDNEEAIATLKKSFDEMSDYQKTFLATSSKDLLQAYVDKIAELNDKKNASKDSETETE